MLWVILSVPTVKPNRGRPCMEGWEHGWLDVDELANMTRQELSPTASPPTGDVIELPEAHHYIISGSCHQRARS